jgi:nicotinamidase-related amidase
MKRWEEVFPEADRSLWQKRGFVARQAFGNRPALLVIDVNWGFIGSTPRPLIEAIEEYRTSCGEAGWVALAHIKELLEHCRAKCIPVIFTTGDPAMRQVVGGAGKGDIATKMPDAKADEIAKDIAPLSSELVIRKPKASAFFATPLLLCLRSMGIDSLIVTGGTTSGCVRATVVDACSYGFRCIVVEECTFDRFELSHLVSLFDMNAKYADVISIDEALEYVEKICKGC